MSRQTSEQDLGANLAALVFAAFAIVLLNAFLSHRAMDEGQLGILAGNLGGGPWFGWEGFRDSLVGTLAALLILVSWFGLGSLIGRLALVAEDDKPASFLNIAIPAALGAARDCSDWLRDFHSDGVEASGLRGKGAKGQSKV